ncbi:unnamed protein product [Phytophthora lilii]|uniref:Unnamed protein product n=1 Tax=Phytophthora lilii TaxID=2077276 RepID=A0A9W6TVA7_9STRA|nr:unnamed protein product [Phytophthora lilii]
MVARDVAFFVQHGLEEEGSNLPRREWLGFLSRSDEVGERGSMQVLFVEENNDNEDEEAAAARRICGAGGWVVKVSGNFTFQFMRHLATAMFPHAVGDEMLLARLIGLRMTCPVRLFLYFNAQRELVQQVAQADMLPALQEARPREIAALINSDNSSERDQRPVVISSSIGERTR